MFGDMAILTIMVSLNISIMMLVMFMWYLSRLGDNSDRQEVVTYEERT